MRIRFTTDDGVEVVPAHEFGDRPRAGDRVTWGESRFEVTGPAAWERLTPPGTRGGVWVLSMQVTPTASGKGPA